MIIINLEHDEDYLVEKLYKDKLQELKDEITTIELTEKKRKDNIYHKKHNSDSRHNKFITSINKRIRFSKHQRLTRIYHRCGDTSNNILCITSHRKSSDR